MNIQELKKKMETVPDHKMNHLTPFNKPLQKMKHHDISTGKSVKHRALEGAKEIKPNQHFGPGRIRSSEETRSMLSPGALKQYDRQKSEISKRDALRKKK